MLRVQAESRAASALHDWRHICTDLGVKPVSVASSALQLDWSLTAAPTFAKTSGAKASATGATHLDRLLGQQQNFVKDLRQQLLPEKLRPDQPPALPEMLSLTAALLQDAASTDKSGTQEEKLPYAVAQHFTERQAAQQQTQQPQERQAGANGQSSARLAESAQLAPQSQPDRLRQAADQVPQQDPARQAAPPPVPDTKKASGVFARGPSGRRPAAGRTSATTARQQVTTNSVATPSRTTQPGHNTWCLLYSEMSRDRIVIVCRARATWTSSCNCEARQLAAL